MNMKKRSAECVANRFTVPKNMHSLALVRMFFLLNFCLPSDTPPNSLQLYGLCECFFEKSPTLLAAVVVG